MKDLTVIMEDQPGKLADLGEATGRAGVNIEVAYTIFTGVRLVILTEDVDKARAALDLNGAAG